MRVELKFLSPPFSINKFYYIRTKTRTQAARAWGADLHDQLLKNYPTAFDKMRKTFDKDKHCLTASLIFYRSPDKLLTKSGAISRLALDLTNVEKPLVDLLFQSKYRDRDGIPTLAIDDQYLVRVVSEKRVADIDHIVVIIELHTLQELGLQKL